MLVIDPWPQESKMALVWSYNLVSQPGSTPILGEATFTDDEETRLRAYDRYTDELREISIMKFGAPGTLQLDWRQGEGLSVTTELPPDEQVFALLHRLRPFVLDEEDTNFHKVSNTIARQADHALIRAFLRVQKDLFASKPSQHVVRIFSNEVLLNCEATLKQWLNAYEYHRDADKRQALEYLHRLFPLDASRAIFVTMLYDKADAVRNLHTLVRLILGKQNTWTWTSADP
jgi:hypothetical protein